METKKKLPRDIPTLPTMEQLKRPNLESIELPPLPPEDESFPSLPELPPLPDEPKLKQFDEEIQSPIFPEIPEDAPSELPPFPEMKREIPRINMGKIEEEDAKKEKALLEKARERRIEKPIFVRVEDFKQVLADINEIKAEIKNAEDCLVQITEVKNEKDKGYNAWNSELKDLERKFIFIDKTLFETKYV